MKVRVEKVGDLPEEMTAEGRRGARAVRGAVAATADAIKQDWRAQIRATLGSRLPGTIRSVVYPPGAPSLSAAAQVWTKAPTIIAAHERGAVIRSASGFYLAIPLEGAGRGVSSGGRAQRITPGGWERRTGQRLRFVFRRGRPSLLVADAKFARTRAGVLSPRRGRRRKDGILTGEQTVPIFVLVPQVQLRKRLNLIAAAGAEVRGLSQAIAQRWGR
jgi:hypothetical protein